jgi:PAS domain S-box-containing protein
MPLTTLTDGPFSRPDLNFDVPPDFQGVLLSTFQVVCALVVVVLNLTVGVMHRNSREVAAERDRLRNVVDGITNVAVIGGDLQGNVTLFNPGAQKLLGYTAEEILGTSTRGLHSVQSVRTKAEQLGVEDDFRVVARTLMDRGEPSEMGFVRKDGEERRHWMSLSRVVDDRGQVVGYVSTSEDITDRLEVERRLVEALETERQAVEQLREVDRVKDAFVSSVSHELRTPITSIMGYTELLEEGAYGELPGGALDAVRRMASNSTRLMTLISELLTLSRIDADGIGAADAEVDLTQVVRTALAVISPTVARRDVALTVSAPPHPVITRGDRDMLERVVINLTENAVKFTPDGGRVEVLLMEEGIDAVVSVSDTGIGVPAHEQKRLFDRFFRSSLAQKEAIPGSGLGLSIAHTIIEKHGGSLRVTSTEGVGSTFRVTLPLTSVPAPVI